MKNLVFSCLCCAGLLVASFAKAQNNEDRENAELLQSCYAAAQTVDQKSACIYSVSAACQEKTEGGYSTIGMTQCNHSETVAWDVLLNEEYALTMRDFKLMDEDDKTYNPDLPEEATRADTLKKAQRAWIAFRDAECANEYAIWGMGSMRLIVGSACMLDMTAGRTIELWSKREEVR